MKENRAKIEAAVVRPIFDSVSNGGHRDRSLPDVVFDNRRSRAYSRILDALVSRGGITPSGELRTRLESMIEAWSNQAFDDAFMPIQEFEIRCARERDLVIAEESGDPRQLLDVREKEYRRRVVERYGSIELRGIQLNHRVILDLDQVYIPMHFEALRLATFERGEPIPLSSMRARWTIKDTLKESARVFLVGAPGSGKSTLVSFLANRCAVGSHGLNWPKNALPFVITIRELKDAVLGPEWVGSHLGIEPELVIAALNEKRAVLLIDGMDEAPEDLRGQFVTALAKFTGKYRHLPVIVTSRPAGAPGEIESCLPGFRGFRLTDFTDAEVSTFVDKWCLAAERSARSDSSESSRQANLASADLKARIARSRPVQRIAVNPLLTTILCVVHRFLGRTIPEHRVTLYEKCTDALLYEWDRAKFPKDAAVGNLDANQKRTLLRGVASALHEKHQAELPESEVVAHFAAMLPQMGQPQADALRIVREIRDRSGVLVERRPGAFAFSHLTFQEYLTALDCASRSRDLLEKLDDPWWHEVVALTAGIPGCDAAGIIDGFLSKNTPERIFMAAKCLETAISVPLDIRKKVEDALENILLLGDWELDERLPEIGLTVAPILTRGLLIYPANKMARAINFFLSYVYEPVIPVLIQLTANTQITSSSIERANGEYLLTVGELAIFGLYDMARNSDRARAGLVAVLSKARVSRYFLNWLKPWGLLGEEFKPAVRAKRASTRAKNTA